MLDVEQNSEEWRQARCGSLGASGITEALAGGTGASRENIKARLIAERLTGSVSESFTNASMQWGHEQEDNAANAYSFLSGNPTEKCGLYRHPVLNGTHASPDRLVGDDGLIEIKCPNTATHIEYLKSQKVPAKYVKQIQWQLACTGRQWCDFVSYDPRLPEDLQTFVKRVDRDNEQIAKLETEVSKFLDEIQADIEALNNLRSK